MMITVTEKRFGEYHKDDKAVSLRNRSGTCGGGSESRGLLLMKYVKVKQNTKSGYAECELGGVVDLAYPSSKTRRDE